MGGTNRVRRRSLGVGHEAGGENDTAARRPRLAIASCAAARRPVVTHGIEHDVRPRLGRRASGLASRNDEALERVVHLDLAERGGEALGLPAGRWSTRKNRARTARRASEEGPGAEALLVDIRSIEGQCRGHAIAV